MWYISLNIVGSERVKFNFIKDFSSYDCHVAATVNEHFNGHTVKANFHILMLNANFINSGYRVNL